MQDELLQLMMKFQLCYEIPNSAGNYIAPQLLATDQPDYEWDETNNLHLRYTYEFMPKGIITRLIVKMHKNIHEQGLVWRSGVILSKANHTKAEVIEYYQTRKITIRASGSRKKELMTIIMHEIDTIHDAFHGLKFDKLIPCYCSTCQQSKEPNFYKVNDLNKFIEKNVTEIPCMNSGESVSTKGLLDGMAHQPDTNKRKNHPRPAPKNKVFISYCHKNEVWKDHLMDQLNVLQMENKLDVWEDRQIKAGDDWYDNIKTALDQASVAVMLITAQFLNSNFIRTEEVPSLLKKREKEGLRIIPIILEPCPWDEVDWLNIMQVVPKDGIPLEKYSDYERKEHLCQIAKDIAKG